MASPNKDMFTYLKILSLIECRHNWFLKMLKQYITPQNKPLKSPPRLELKKHVFTIILFYFLYAMTCLDTVQKTFPKKCVNSYDRWEKTSYLGISAEGYRWNHETEVASKKVCWKNNKVFQTLVTYRQWKRYIVIPFILVLCDFNFCFKIMWSSQQN